MPEYNDPAYGRDFFVLTSMNCPERISDFYGYYYSGKTISIRVNPVTLLDKNSAGSWVNIQTVPARIIIQQDFFCSFGLYVFQRQDYWAVSNSFYLLARFLSDKFSLSVNWEYLALFKNDMVPVSATETAINEIQELAAGEYLIIDPHSHELSRGSEVYNLACVNMFSPEGIRIIDEWHGRYARLLQEIVNSGFNLSCDLSGGFDSRAAFSCLFKPDIYRKAWVYAPDDKIHTHADDFRLACQIASIYAFPIRLVREAYREFSPYEAILNSLKTKFFFHTQVYFKSHYFLKPVFNLNGGAGEMFRTMGGGDAEGYINMASPKKPILGQDLTGPVRNILRRTWEQISARHTEALPDVLKIYRYTRLKNHFARTAVESFLCNLISVSPLMDPLLYQLDLTPPGVSDRNTFFAFLYCRFMPEILGLPFDRGRKIEAACIHLAQKINAKFPYRCVDRIEQPIIIRIEEKRTSTLQRLPRANSTTRYFGELFKAAEVKKFIQSRYGDEIYRLTVEVFDADTYWGFWRSTRLFFEYLLHCIIKKREGFHFPYAQVYLPQSLIQGDGALHDFLKKARVAVQIRNAETPADIPGEGISGSDPVVYLDTVVSSFPYSRKMLAKKAGTAELLLSADPDFFPDNPQYMVDILKIRIFSKSANKTLFECDNIFCLDSSPYRAYFTHKEEEEITLTIDARTNALWLYSWMTHGCMEMSEAFANLPARADNISNQYNH